MSVMMAMRLTVDPERFMEIAKKDPQRMQGIAERGKQMGAVHHMFLAGDGEVMVADEWDSQESFLAFFEAAGPEIGALMQDAGVSNEPKPVFWQPLDTSDRF